MQLVPLRLPDWRLLNLFLCANSRMIVLLNVIDFRDIEMSFPRTCAIVIYYVHPPTLRFSVYSLNCVVILPRIM